MKAWLDPVPIQLTLGKAEGKFFAPVLADVYSHSYIDKVIALTSMIHGKDVAEVEVRMVLESIGMSDADPDPERGKLIVPGPGIVTVRSRSVEWHP